MRKHNRLFKKYKTFHSPMYLDHYKSLKHQIQREVRRLHSNYINSIITPLGTHNKKFWSYIKNLKKDTCNIPSLFVNGSEVLENQAKTEVFNDHFQSVFTKEDTSRLPSKGPSPYQPLDDFVVTTAGIDNLLVGLDVHKASGPDHISARVLKEAHSELAPIFQIIFQHSLDSGLVPQDWKIANIVPVHKKGDKSSAPNYRPVSLTSISSKIFEHILASQIMHHLQSNNILSDSQHGFRRNRSCESQLIAFVHDLMLNHNNGIQSDIIYTDFAKAFDKVPHQRLLYKLKWYGIDNNIYQWIKSFLTNRHQLVIIDGSISSPIPVTSGVPQGTVLGPILFSIYINDLPEVIKHSTIRLFADDCILYRQIKCTEDAILLQSDINSFMEWASIWQMKLNVDKCHSMSVTLSKLYTISRTYYMDNSPLSQVDSCKYLGVIIQSDLKWNMHVNYITAKANKTLGFLKRNISCASIHAKKLAYTVFIRSQLEYAATVWEPWQSTLISRLEQIQRRAARFVTNTYTRDPTVSVTNLMDQLDWESLESR